MSASLVLLGTGSGPTPKVDRNAPSQALIVEGVTYLIDCGNAVGPQLVRARIPLSSLKAVFLTHHHFDHNADFGTLFLAAWSQLPAPVAIYGPPPLRRMMRLFLDLHKYDIELRASDEGRPPLRDLVDVHEVRTGGVVFEDERVKVTAVRVHHPPVDIAFGYRFDTSERSFVFSGDTTVCQDLIELASGADVLVHEAVYAPGLEAGIAGYRAPKLMHHLLTSHTTAEQAGVVARAAGVRTLVLSHLFPPDASVPDETWRTCAQSQFDGEVIVGRDLLVV